jgi:hypothetical protein
MKEIRYKGKDIGVGELDVLTSNEPWNEYQLSIGQSPKGCR